MIQNTCNNCVFRQYEGLVFQKWYYTDKFGTSRFKPYFNRVKYNLENPLLLSIKNKDLRRVRDLVETEGYDCGEIIQHKYICHKYFKESTQHHITRCSLCRGIQSPFIIYLQFACVVPNNRRIIDYFLTKIDLSKYNPSTIEQLIYTIISTHIYQSKYIDAEYKLCGNLKLLLKHYNDFEMIDKIKMTLKYFRSSYHYRKIIQILEGKKCEIIIREELENVLPNDVINRIMEFV